jgi:hypothetical protein
MILGGLQWYVFGRLWIAWSRHHLLRPNLREEAVYGASGDDDKK